MKNMHRITIKLSPNVNVSKKDATTIGQRWAKRFVDDGGRKGQCSSAIRESVNGVEVLVFVDYYVNGLLTVTITNREEARVFAADIATDKGELQDLAAEAFLHTLPHDGQNRCELP